MTNPQGDIVLKPETPASGAISVERGHALENCARLRDLGFKPSKHIKMYGERLEIVSDPFSEGTGIAVHAVSVADPRVRILRLPIAIILGKADRFLKKRA